MISTVKTQMSNFLVKLKEYRFIRDSQKTYLPIKKIFYSF
jgi:hypothetical protein